MHALVKMKPCQASLSSQTEKNSTHERLQSFCRSHERMCHHGFKDPFHELISMMTPI